MPAAYTGVVGYKPSYGLVSRNGVVAYANSLDTVGFLARTVTYLSDIKSTFVQDVSDPTSMSLQTRQNIKAEMFKKRSGLERPLRVGIPVEYNIEELDPKIREAWNETAKQLQRGGCDIIPISLPHTQYALSAYYVLAPAEASSNLARYDSVRYGDSGYAADAAGGALYAKRRGELLGKEVKKRILMGTYSLSSEAMDNYFLRAQKVRRLVQQDFDNIFYSRNVLLKGYLDRPKNKNGVDFILCPTAPTLAPKLADLDDMSPSEKYMNDVFTVPASLAGLPAISLPYGGRSGPERNIGMQLIGQYGSDKFLINIAHYISTKKWFKKPESNTAHLPIEQVIEFQDMVGNI